MPQRGFILAILAVVLLGLVARAPQRSDDALSLSSRVSGASGGVGLYLAAGELGLPVERNRSDWSLFARGRVDRVLASLARPAAPTRAEAEGLLDWIERGGNAFVIPHGLAGATSDPESPETADPEAESFDRPPADPLLAALELELVPARGSLVLGPAADEATWFSGLGPEFGTAGQVFEANGSTGSPAGGRALLVDAEGRAGLLELELGRGRLVLLSEARALSNARLADSHLPAVVLTAWADLAGDSRRLLFDEYGHSGGLGGTNGTLWVLLTETPTGHAVLGLAALAALALGLRSVRLGSVAEEPPPPPRSVTEHVEALARGYTRVGAVQRPLQALVEDARRRLGSRDADHLVERLGEGSRGTPELESAFRDLQRVLGDRFERAGQPPPKRFSLGDLVSTTQHLDLLVSSLTLGHNSARRTTFQ